MKRRRYGEYLLIAICERRGQLDGERVAGRAGSMNGCCRLESGSVKIFSGADAGHLAVGPAFSLVDDGLILVTSQLCVSNVGMPL